MVPNVVGMMWLTPYTDSVKVNVSAYVVRISIRSGSSIMWFNMLIYASMSDKHPTHTEINNPLSNSVLKQNKTFVTIEICM